MDHDKDFPQNPVPTGQADRQLPVGDEIFLDHVGHFVPDVAAACDVLTRAGFAPTPVSRQVDPRTGEPTGTGNVTAMLRRGYMEVLFRTADTPLGRELDAAVARHPGLHLAAFAVANAADAHRRLADAGFRMRPLVEMARPVDTATGRSTAAFTIARVEPGEMAEGRIQILTHRTEDTVWQPRWLDHPNGSVGLHGLMIAAADVDETAERFARFTGRRAVSSRLGRVVHLDRGRVDIVTAETFAQVLPEIAIPSLPLLGAYGLLVRSLDRSEAVLRAATFPSRRIGAALAVPFPPPLGLGAWLFAEAAMDFPWR
jgi:Glyoxalase-like domain